MTELEHERQVLITSVEEEAPSGPKQQLLKEQSALA